MSAALYRKVRKPCTSPYGCGRRVQTLAYQTRPVCRACRRRLANLDKAPSRATARRWNEYEDRRDYHRAYYRAQKASEA